MGRRGPPKKAAKLEVAHGYPGKRKRETHAAIAVAESMQDDARQSEWSPEPPAWLVSKRAREIWRAKFAMPESRIWLKRTDTNFIARHCQKAAQYESLVKRSPAPTIKVVASNGAKVVRPNPAYRIMLELDKELRAEEQLMAGNPLARINLETRLATEPPGSDRPPNASSYDHSARFPNGPVGIFKSDGQSDPRHSNPTVPDLGSPVGCLKSGPKPN